LIAYMLEVINKAVSQARKEGAEAEKIYTDMQMQY